MVHKAVLWRLENEAGAGQSSLRKGSNLLYPNRCWPTESLIQHYPGHINRGLSSHIRVPHWEGYCINGPPLFNVVIRKWRETENQTRDHWFQTNVLSTDPPAHPIVDPISVIVLALLHILPLAINVTIDYDCMFVYTCFYHVQWLHN